QVEGFFHSASAWTQPLQALGHEVLDVTANNAPLQTRWMVENDRFDVAKTFSDALVFGRHVMQQKQDLGWQRGFVAEQVKKFKPDVLLCANLYMFDDTFLGMVKGSYGKAVGQHAAVMPRNSLKHYDLIISSLPNQVAEFSRHGIRSEVVKLAFDERLLTHLDEHGKPHDVAFIGQISPHHRGRAHFIADVAKGVPIAFWGDAAWPEDIDPAGLKITGHPPLWGLQMYQTLKDCRMVLNFHLDAAGQYANNLRLFEVTGVGSLLMTDNKLNIGEYFEPGREIVVYDDAADCVDKIRKLQSAPDVVAAISQAGQQAVLSRHTYHHRVHDLLALID
ncbi:MAG: glycosyltransferase, partial [Rhodospirillales bacterium]|nr:glycosyltransferase [Rhodospirillales bacterium]